MNRIARYLSARVGRRLFLLFVVSAFLPLAALAALSFVQLREMLLQQGEQRLAATAKGYGMTVFERLLLASDLAAASVSPNVAPPSESSLTRRTFRSLARVQPDGRVVRIFGDPPLSALTAAARARLAEGKSAAFVDTATGGALVTLAIPATRGGEAIALAELSPEYLWQPDQFPTATDFCVLDEDSRGMLFCSVPMPAEAIRAIIPTTTQSALRTVRWSREGGDDFRSIAWAQFMREAFGTPDWIVVASQPESVQLMRVIEYQHIYIPVVALALLLVSWLTIRQSRSIVEPVAQLAARARGIAQNDFATRLDMRRQDEFGELAGAFDQMAAKLGRQFAALSALSEIDRLILSTLDTVQVVRTVLERMGDVVPAEFVGITLFDRDSPDHAHAYFRESHSTEGLSFARVEIRPEDHALLAQNPQGAWITLSPQSPGILGVLRQRGVQLAYVQPIVWREAVCGALALGYRTVSAGPEEERQQARDFADRVAVAVSSAWRDEQLYQQAHYDSLTGLPNRLLFKDRLGQEIVRGQREERRFAVLFVDIDRFKIVNDTLGHTAGDSVLRDAAKRISAGVRESDTVARLGGDEFTVVLTNINHPQDAGRAAEQIVQALSKPFSVDGQDSFLSASVGIACYPEDGSTTEELLKNADTAMYRAKAGGRAMVVYFEERMNADAVARLTLDRDLRQAIERGELSMHYQPLVDLGTGRIRGAEALLRWHHPERGMILPVRFIPVAEETGFIEQLGRFALREACTQMSAWIAEGLPVGRVSVNVSPRQLRNAGFTELITRSAANAGLALDRLEIEITEGLLIDHADTVGGLLSALAATGVRIALDDFGTGFSSMAYLNRFPIHTIKIDRVFIDGLGRSRDSEAIVVAIIAMSHALGKGVVAEGVETASQLEFLRGLGCDEVQGYHFAHPMPAAEFRQFVLAREARGTPSAAPSPA